MSKFVNLEFMKKNYMTPEVDEMILSTMVLQSLQILSGEEEEGIFEGN